jgi:cytoskeletal protein RodZ
VPASEASEFGASLREARERSGLDLKEISHKTKISTGILKALETGDLSAVPGGLFGRSFVRAYAAEVGLEPEATVEAFLRAFPELQPDKAEAPRVAPQVAVPREDSGDVRTVAIRLGLMSVPVVALLLFFGLRNGPESQEFGVGTPASEDRSTTRLEAEAAASPLTIEIYPSGPCWVSLTADGEELLAGVLSDGQRRVFQADEGFVLSVGDAGLFNFSINQQPARPLGGDGETVTVEIDRDNYGSFVSP